jgi:ATP-dependent RNA helicase RhlE
MKTFAKFSLSPLLNANLSRNGFDVPTTIQAAAIGPAPAGKDLIATAQTGTGKMRWSRLFGQNFGRS